MIVLQNQKRIFFTDVSRLKQTPFLKKKKKHDDFEDKNVTLSSENVSIKTLVFLNHGYSNKKNIKDTRRAQYRPPIPFLNYDE